MTSSCVDLKGRWFRPFRTVEHPRIRLFCFPHAGGGASGYRDWPSRLPSDVDVLAVRYPGREDRLSEPGMADIDVLADSVAAAIRSVPEAPVALFGHSMGAWVAYEVACRLGRTAGLRLLLVSGQVAPDRKQPAQYQIRTETQLLERLRELGGTDAEVFADPDLRELLLPVLLTDYQLLRDYRPVGSGRLSVPVVAYSGDSDPYATAVNVAAWADATSGSFDHRVFPGGHFYLTPPDNRSALLTDVGAWLDSVTRRSGDRSAT